MGYAFRTALDKVKVPALDVYGDPILVSYGYPIYPAKWMVYLGEPRGKRSGLFRLFQPVRSGS
jgi:hypothetical protein